MKEGSQNGPSLCSYRFEKENGMVKEETTDTSQKSEVKKKTPKKRIDKNAVEIKKLKEKNEQLKDQLLRKVAEFDNYKKRTERDYYDRILNANEKLITELLPVLDDIKRAVDHARQSNEVDTLIEGTELIQKKMQGILEKLGLEEMPSEGENFDPEKHEALMQVEKKGVESGTIVEEHLIGFTLNGKVIRHSQVIVAK